MPDDREQALKARRRTGSLPLLEQQAEEAESLFQTQFESG